MKKILILSFLTILIFSCGRFGKKQNETTGNLHIVCVSMQLNETNFATNWIQI